MIKYLMCLSMVMSSIHASNILVIAPSPNVGHWLYIEEFIKSLLYRGHTVTGITNYNLRQPNERYTPIVVPVFNVNEYYPSKNIFLGSYSESSQNMWMNWRIGLLNSEHILKNGKVQELINSKELKFDLVLADSSYHESLYMFAHKFSCPLVTIAPFGHTTAIDHAKGLVTPLSFIPHESLPYSDDMTYFQRVHNVYIYMYDVLLRKFNYLPAQNKLAKKYFRDGIPGVIPDVSKLERETAVTLVNTHRAFETPRPQMPGQISVGAAHIQQALVVPVDLKEFIEGAENGVIVFSLGTQIKFSEMPKEKLDQVMDTFGSIKQRVLLKVDTDIPGLTYPENVMARTWIPQRDVLAHPNVVLFINHGGILGIQEALQSGLPMLFIPFLNSQQRIASKFEKFGNSLVLQFDDLTKETFSAAINEITTEEKYKKRGLAASILLNDNLAQPMFEALYWMEYSIKHNGASHLRSPAVSHSLSKYLLLDVALFFFGIFTVSFLFWVLIIKLCLKRYRAKEQKGKFKYY